MKSTWLYRTAAVLFILFALGHTFGFLHFRPATPEGVAVHDAMNNVHFQIKSGDFTYGKFYTGFGLFVTAYLLFSAFLAWHLGDVVAKHPQAVGALGWGFFAVQVACLALSWIYFFAGPVAFSGLTTACLGWAAWQLQGSHTTNDPVFHS